MEEIERQLLSLVNHIVRVTHLGKRPINEVFQPPRIYLRRDITDVNSGCFTILYQNDVRAFFVDIKPIIP
ncbi:hypothetical protein A5642_12630 [Mycolicibacterium mucogenicum]|uniref:Uncharacterized protein n=1 Tax=Mycolicibacterium mucogenicum TaxID=56689 RepID=A0A1A0MZA2_MYCMU|nr:hypothetical protein A5642_12630 [Mycolicibacterium mucogenicum]